MKTIIHVNQHVIRKNKKTGTRNPVLTIKTYKETRYAHTLCGHGTWVIKYQPDKPLSCGAHVWLEVDSADVGGRVVSKKLLRVTRSSTKKERIHGT